jgi:carboxyl-terminal processing protease
VWALIGQKHIDADEVSSEDRIYGAIKGLVASLDDPYSSFLDPEENSYFSDNLAGEFGGVGMEVEMQDGLLVVVSPLKESPAYKAGIKPGDIVSAVNGESLIGMSIDQSIQLIRGEVGKDVELSVFRPDEEENLEITITRAIIELPVIDTRIEDDVFIIELYSFTESSSQLFISALEEFIDSNVPYLVLDLRGNPGGYLGAAQDIASWFLPAGKSITIEKTADGGEYVYRSKGFDVFTDELKMVVLVNGGSASASEIVAGALRDHEKATIVGTQTFGKGTVQELIKLNKDSALKVTIAKWLTPNGISISEGGLEPDVIVEITKEDVEAEIDPQLEKAIEVVKGL